jgi:hypothetical protein
VNIIRLLVRSRAATETDSLLRRIERDSIIACAAMAIGGAMLARPRAAVAAGVIGGGALAWISYRGIKGGIDALVAASSGPPSLASRASAWRGLVKFFTRYAILAIVAYVIMARLRLPPVAVVAGASSLVVAIALQAVRSLRDNPSKG